MNKVWLFGSIVASALFIACMDEDQHTLTWENETRRHLVITLEDSDFQDSDDYELELPPCRSKSKPISSARWTGVVTIYGALGGSLLRTEMSWNDLKENGFKFIVKPESLPPRDSQDPSIAVLERNCPEPLPSVDSSG